MKKTNIKAILILCALFAPLAVHAQDAVRLERTDALVVCRSKQCKPANSIMTKEFVYNKLAAYHSSNFIKLESQRKSRYLIFLLSIFTCGTRVPNL